MAHKDTVITENAGTLIIVVGMPGSGKSTYIQTLLEQHPEYTAYDDYQGQGYNYDADPRLSKYFGEMVSGLKDNKTVIVSDVRYCVPYELNLFLAAVLTSAPMTRMVYHYFANTPEQCRQNVRSRNREGRVERELELIDMLSAGYYMPVIETIPVYTPSQESHRTVN